MNFRILAIASVLGCSLGVGCGGDDDDNTGGTGGGSGSGALKANCEKICAITEPLNCADDPADCVNNCQSKVTSSAKCRTVGEAAIACSAPRPASDWACDEFGESMLKEGVCTSEINAVIACFASGG